jgi:hypothetical protein
VDAREKLAAQYGARPTHDCRLWSCQRLEQFPEFSRDTNLQPRHHGLATSFLTLLSSKFWNPRPLRAHFQKPSLLPATSVRGSARTGLLTADPRLIFHDRILSEITSTTLLTGHIDRLRGVAAVRFTAPCCLAPRLAAGHADTRRRLAQHGFERKRCGLRAS